MFQNSIKPAHVCLSAQIRFPLFYIIKEGLRLLKIAVSLIGAEKCINLLDN